MFNTCRTSRPGSVWQREIEDEQIRPSTRADLYGLKYRPGLEHRVAVEPKSSREATPYAEIVLNDEKDRHA